MPELGEQMYCSEQICIPPAFPYLLRQFAKAAIRTQPLDLLKWSTAYFRCLSLNIPPPVKPRLEYPIPRDHYGVTPGWLKALLYQLQTNTTVSFKILWDRWTGACLEHNTLIQILCLGGFNNPFAIPWLRFIGLCAAHLTDDLTHTMILICEIMTEEPEGGSAMIPLETFTDLYQFLADIDASKPQVLKNFYFTDDLLGLLAERAAKDEGPRMRKIEVVSEEESAKTTVSEVSEEKVIKKGDSKEVISCPSIAGDDDYSVDYAEAGKELSVEGEESVQEESSETATAEAAAPAAVEGMGSEGMGSGEKSVASEEGAGSEAGSGGSEADKMSKKGSAEDADAGPEGQGGAEGKTGSGEDLAEPAPYESVDTIQEEPRKIEPDFYEDERVLREDLARVRALQEMPGEEDVELEKYKCKLIAEMPLTKSQEDALLHFAPGDSKTEVESEEMKGEGEGEEEKYEDVYVDAIPGIGPRVPEHLVKAVCEYMKSVAAIQHGMVMPRNIRHYNCPPLEVMHY